MSGLKDFAKRILRRRSQPAGDASEQNEALSLLLKLMKQQLKQEANAEGGEQLCKLQLAELILPRVLNEPPKEGETKDLVNHDVAKDWAFACAGTLGFLAGLSLQSGAIEGALNEANRIAKSVARDTNTHLSTILSKYGISEEAPKPKPVVRSNSKTNATAALEQKRKMADDLDSEAEQETGKGNTAGAAALKIMAERLRVEISLEDGTYQKKDKSVA